MEESVKRVGWGRERGFNDVPDFIVVDTSLIIYSVYTLHPTGG